MKKHPLQTILEDAGYETRSYSGRGMFGRSCLGVSLAEASSLGDVAADVIEQLEEEDGSVLAQVSEGFRSLKTDSLGRGAIVYFTSVNFTEDDVEDEQADSTLEGDAVAG